MRNDSGISLIETILAMGITVALGAVSFRLYTEAMEKTRRIRLQADVAEIEKRVNLEWAGRGWGAGTDAARVKKLQGKGLDLTTPWGGEISLSFSEGVQGGAKALARPFFGVEIPGLNRARCIWAATTFAPGSICLSINSAAADCRKLPAEFLSACRESDDNRIVARYRKG